MTVVKTGLLIFLACVAGVRKGRGRELGRKTTRPTRSRAPKFPLPLLTPATQAKHFQTNLTSRENQENIKALILKNLDS